MADYIARIADQELAARLRVMGAVLIEGPKASGKTAAASEVARTIIRFDEDPVARAAVELDPRVLVTGGRRSCSTNGRSSRRSGTACGVRSMIAKRGDSSSSPDQPARATT